MEGLKDRYIYTYGNSYNVPSPNSKKRMNLFRKICRGNGIICDPDECFKYLNDLPDKQISIFDL